MTQEKAFEIMMKGENVFLTGKAGTGKTTILKKVISEMRKKKKVVACTAPTGVAATHLEGRTIHSWAGIGIKDFMDDSDLREIANNPRKAESIKDTHVLIIDEISMLHDFRLDLVDKVCKMIKRRPDLPFGGIQIIVCGDFYQLPPVVKDNKNYGEGRKNYTFNAQSWKDANFTVCYLQTVYRQAGDPVLTDLLNSIRSGTVTSEHRSILSELSNNTTHRDKAINLYFKRKDVHEENVAKLHALGKVPDYRNYTVESKGNKFLSDLIIKNWNAEETLVVRPKAKVMFIANHPDGLYINGSMGEITGFNTVAEFCGEDYIPEDLEQFDREKEFPIVRLFENGSTILACPKEWKMSDKDKSKINHLKDIESDDEDVNNTGYVYQVPLRLAWAITIHKSQGCSFDYVNLSLEGVKDTNIGYVALSRVRSLAGLYLSGFSFISTKVDPVVMHKNIEFERMSMEAEAR